MEPCNTMLGKYEIFPGIWVPDAGELAAGASAGATGTLATNLAKSQGVQTAAKGAGVETLFQKIGANPVISASIFGGLLLGAAYMLRK